MPRGRKPKPTAQREREGNPGKRPLNTDEPSAGKGAPEPPEWLSGRAAELWPDISATLERMGVLDRADQLSLAMLCEAWATWVINAEVCREKGDTYEAETREGEITHRTRPEATKRDQAWAQVVKLLPEFGLTPSSRVRLGTRSEPEDALEQLLKSRARN